jgi:hypothetical protein
VPSAAVTVAVSATAWPSGERASGAATTVVVVASGSVGG